MALVSAALLLLCLPAWRERVFAALHGPWQKLRARPRAAPRVQTPTASTRWPQRLAAAPVQAPVQALWQTLADAAQGLRAPRIWLLVALAVLVLLPAAALLLRQWHGYDGFDHTWRPETNPHIAELLRGEQLVPPPRLPPELFTTQEVLRARPLVATASRQWELLDADFRQRLLLAFKLMREQHGIEMVLIEGYRSPERQAQLAAMGETVTHAGPGQSYHQFGLAADCAFLFEGRIVISERDARAARGYALYGEVAQSLGLTWGGTWRGLVDLGHVELPRAGALQSRSARN